MRDAIQVDGSIQSVDSRKKDRYFVVVKNRSPLSLNHVIMTVWYSGGNQADIDFKIGRIDFDPQQVSNYDQRAAGPYSELIAINDPLPSGGKVTVHIGDVIANSRTGVVMPRLTVEVGAENARSKRIEVWSHRVGR
jgi:hypothetical protein